MPGVDTRSVSRSRCPQSAHQMRNARCKPHSCPAFDDHRLQEIPHSDVQRVRAESVQVHAALGSMQQPVL